MPHVTASHHAPPDPDPPVVRVSTRCPSCGRAPAVVFPDLRPGVAPKDAPLVCLECCPKGPAVMPRPAAGGGAAYRDKGSKPE